MLFSAIRRISERRHFPKENWNAIRLRARGRRFSCRWQDKRAKTLAGLEARKLGKRVGPKAKNRLPGTLETYCRVAAASGHSASLDFSCEREHSAAGGSDGRAERQRNRRQEAARSDAETSRERLLQRTHELRRPQARGHPSGFAPA